MMKKAFVLSLLIFVSSCLSATDEPKKNEPQGKTFNFLIDTRMEGPEGYRELYIMLMFAKENDVVRIHLNTPGGNLNTTVQIVNALRETKAHTVAIVYEASSGGSMIMLSCKEIQLGKFASVMVHSMGYGQVSGSVPDLDKMIEASKQLNEDLITTIYKGFLTKDEMVYVLNGGTIWSQGKDLEQRVKNWSKNKK